MLLFMKGLKINLKKATGKQFFCKGMRLPRELQENLLTYRLSFYPGS